MWHGLRLANELGVSDRFRHLAKGALSISRRVAPIAGEPRVLIMLHTAKKVCEPFHTRFFVPSENAIEVGDAAIEGLGRAVGFISPRLLHAESLTSHAAEQAKRAWLVVLPLYLAAAALIAIAAALIFWH